ncbi:tRNA-queuosine alpha-mannosyltransferase domain-containing protein [Parahaliea aestuarii]|uniref:tRNA-queuosine alpha-mannosyltransferase n=1 Tax=Parahaliea aestuarii TaxID=1852021 RepID=A0A5C8ZT79_9GAMM|nr:DUF3524 domain-containing protein [Parahaliea aestuarii]TXS90890.1 DUF3524 domain-containing protein [Parahaliea aestuarii]
MRVLLLSAYDAGSHRYWRRGLEAMCPDWQWTCLSLPPRHFSWRVRGNPLHWALRERHTLEAGADLLIATSMVDLATLRGLVPALAGIPTLLYFHENQFAYPPGRGRHGLLEAQMVSLYSALAADGLAFNSQWNRDSFIAGVAALLKKLPDYAPREAADLLAQKSAVLPVPLLPGAEDRSDFNPWRGQGDLAQRPVRLLWPGRQEYDKGGERLEALLHVLVERELDFELAIVGQAFRQTPEVFKRLSRDLGPRLVHMGWLAAVEDYQHLLAQADIVLATALHEFQGVAVMEAVERGCVPVLPQRLAYPELYPAQNLYASSTDHPDREAVAAADRVVAVTAALKLGEAQVPSVQRFTLDALAPRWRRALCALVGDGESR